MFLHFHDNGTKKPSLQVRRNFFFKLELSLPRHTIPEFTIIQSKKDNSQKTTENYFARTKSSQKID
jgi:hypothetical protein